MKKIFFTTIMISLAYFIQAQNNNQKQNVPTFKSENEKKDWIQKNPEVYKSIGGQTNNESVTEKQKVNNQRKPGEQTQTVDYPPYPEYVNTGNPKKDDADFNLKKKEWINKCNAVNEHKKTFLQSKKEKEAWIANNPKNYNP